jgi:uncharacterized protein YggT (Ycf19 family)
MPTPMNPSAVNQGARSIVRAEIASATTREGLEGQDRERIEGLGRDLRHDAVAEAVDGRSAEQRIRVVARLSQIIDYFFGALYAAIAFEFALEMFAARDRNAFKQFLDAVTGPFLAPFRTLLPSFAIGGSEIIFSYVVALIAYALLHVGLKRLATIATDPVGV